jgi:hypothetical protein
MNSRQEEVTQILQTACAGGRESSGEVALRFTTIAPIGGVKNGANPKNRGGKSLTRLRHAASICCGLKHLVRIAFAILIGVGLLANCCLGVDITLTGSNQTDVLVSWQGAPSLSYFVTKSPDLQSWNLLRTNIPGTPAVSLTDFGGATNATMFYFVGSTPYINETEAENALPGTTNWQLSDPVSVADRDWPTLRTRAIEGYASATSVNKGEWITFYVSTTSPTFALEIYRMGYYAALGGRLMPGCSWSNLSGIDQPTPPTQDNGLLPSHLDRLHTAAMLPSSAWQLLTDAR